MKLSAIIIIASFVVLAGLLSITLRKNPLQKGDTQHNGFAVVELFTSEGCSSCPPADKLIANLQVQDKNEPVYILSYHVDYWDRLGWKDRFSDAAFTERQQHYAELLHLNTIYTPQIVVNGRNEFVGSNKSALDKALSASLKDSAVQKLSIQENTSNGKININYETTASKNTDLVINLVQKSAQSSVKAGENAGRELSHVQIVRKQIIQSLNGTKGKIGFDIPNDFKPNECELICFVQDSNSGVVLCAARTELTGN
jgi:hypothetical protein